MKATFISLPALFAGALLAGCVNLEVSSDGADEGTQGGDGDGGDDAGCEGDDCPALEHGLSGDLILFVNARLSDESAAFQAHLPLDEEGTYIGNALYLYDPARSCDDGGNACRLAKLGDLRLDERLGPVSVADNSLRKFVVRDLAWHADQGLWAATFDPLNDEWSVSKLEIDDWARADNEIALDRWVIPPGPAESPNTDPCYWFEAVSGLGFAGDDLIIGVRGAGSKGLISEGSLLRVDTEVFEQGHCVHPSDISQDPVYYACAQVCEHWCSFGDRLGVAGDLLADPEGVGASAWLRSEDEGVMPLSRNEMQTCTAPEPGEVATAEATNIYLDPVVRGDEIEGLARIGAKVYGISVLGKVYEIDEVTRTVEEIDDLSGLFPEQGLRLRGATEVFVPPA